MRLTTTRHLAAQVDRCRGEQPTYAPVGATAGDLPDGYHHTHRRERVGAGPDAFDRAARALLSWEMHRRSGLAVASDGPAAVGATVVLGLGSGIVLVVPCRVVRVVDEPTRRGFAYGTLPGHPEQGEEAFVVAIDGDGSVWCEITAYSRPGPLLVRCAGPVGRAVQSLVTRRYLRSLRSVVDA